MVQFRALGVVVVVALSCASPAWATTITVNTHTDETGNPSTCSLRDAVAAANTDTAHGGCPAGTATNEVVLPPGDYKLTAGELTITSSLTLSGAGATQTAIDGQGGSRLVEIGTSGGPALTVSISDVTLTDGQAPVGADGITMSDPGMPGGSGGAILNHTATLSISDSVLSNDHAGSGGGPGGNFSNGGAGGGGGAIYTDAPLTLSHSSLSSNTAGDGGNSPFGSAGNGGNGGAIQGTGSITLSNSTLISNAAGTGGGADNRDGLGGDGGAIQGTGSITISDSTLSSNRAGYSAQNAGGDGGAIASMASLTVTGSTFASDAAGASHDTPNGDGGAIWSGANGTDQLTNDTITDTSTSAKGALTFAGPSAIVTNVTVARNSGAGVERTSGVVTLRNSLLASNSGGNCSGTITDGHHNLSFPASDHSCPAAFANGDPKLASSLADNGGPTQTLALELGSAAIDQVSPSGADCPPTDQRGVSRPQGPACDIGSYEYNGPGPKLTRLHESRRRFTEHKGTTYSFTLKLPATVTLTFTRLTKRHRVAKVGSITISGHAGANTYFFDGELEAKQLRPGRYRLTVTAGNGKPKMLSFKIVR